MAQATGKSAAEARDIVVGIMKGIRQDAHVFHRLMQMQSRDDYTATHPRHGAVIVMAQAASLDLPERQIQEIGLAAMLHDVGKEMVPPEILQKPGKNHPSER